MAIISNTRSSKAKKTMAKAKAAKAGSARQDTKFVMVTFGRGTEAILESFEKMRKEQGLSQAALAREMIRKCLGYPSHLP